MQRYVVGLMFDNEMRRVVLIHKEHGPEYVVGRWNGVGGKVEQNEVPLDAMVREFEEETSVKTVCRDWHQFVQLGGSHDGSDGVDFAISFYWCRSTMLFDRSRTTTDEEVYKFWVHNLGAYDIVPNLRWMIQFLLDNGTENHLGSIRCTNSDK